MDALLVQLIGLILILIGISMFMYWVLFYIIINKKLTDGIHTLAKDYGLVIFHILAELVAGSVSIIAGLLLLTNNSLAYPVTYAVLGMHVYIGIRTLSWSLVNNNKITPNLLFVTIFSVVAFILLI